MNRCLEERMMRIENFIRISDQHQSIEGFWNALIQALPETERPSAASLTDLKRAIYELSYAEAVLVLFVLYMGVTASFFEQRSQDYYSQMKKLAAGLVEVDRFYRPIGGLIGYYKAVLCLIDKAESDHKGEDVRFLPPPYYDMTNHTFDFWKIFNLGIQHLADSAEVYAVGGAGDRLNLHDDRTGVALPAARMPFLGKTLLEGLFRDLEAKEYLAYKITGSLPSIPVLLMTSSEKNNSEEILQILEENSYFGRPPESFFIIKQPLAPMVTQDGLFVGSAACELLFKPGGHGVIWKLARDCGAFDWLERKGCQYLSIRQVNNPLAFMDCASLILLGIGVSEKKGFGFACCRRHQNVSEGINVLQIQNGKPALCSISNYEYTRGNPVAEDGCDLSECPANTNILFASIEAIKQALKQDCFPGSMVNMRSHQIDSGGVPKAAVRLESTMQNIADLILNALPADEDMENVRTSLKTFLALFRREKLISVTKRSQGDWETPARAFFDYLLWARKCLETCDARMPPDQSFEEFMEEGPNLVLVFHPALGPMEDIISKKLKNICLKNNSELELDLAEVILDSVDISGSLRVVAETAINRNNPIQSPSCFLKNVRITNRGLVKSQSSELHWQRKVERHESCEIRLHGNSSFIAENVDLQGNISIDVPAGCVMRAYAGDDGIVWRTDPIPEEGVFQWNYRLNPNGGLELEYKIK